MELNKIQRFQRMVQSDEGLRERLRRAARKCEGMHLGDRAIFETVVARVARDAGIEISYEEAEAEMLAAEALDGRELSDDELEAVAGGVGTVYQKVMGSIMAVTIAFSAVPTRAIAEEVGSAGIQAADDQTVMVVDDDQETIAADEEQAVVVVDDDLVDTADIQEADEQTTELSSLDMEDFAEVPIQDDVFVQATDATADRQEAEAGIEAYAADVSMADVALPQGLAATTNGIVLTGDVTPAVAAAVEQSGAVATNAANVAYDAGQLGYVDETAQQVKALGSDVFDVISSGTSGYTKAGVVSVQKLLGLVGVLGDSDTVTPQLLSQMKQLNVLMQSMSKQLDENTKQTYQNRLTVFDNAVGALDIECGTMETMYQKGYALAKERGLLETADKNGGVDTVLVKLMREEDEKGNRDFRDFSTLMNSIRTNYETVAVECAKEGGASPFYAYDSYWALYFNFDTQGYYLRQAYRTNAELQLKRAYDLLALYYGLPETLDAGKEAEPLTAALQAALNGIEAQPAGTSPEQALKRTSRASRIMGTPVHCYTTGCDYWYSQLWDFMRGVGPERLLTEDQAKAFCDRLHGHTVAEDLKLAGLMIDYTDDWNAYFESAGKPNRIYPNTYVGLGITQQTYLPFDATSYTPVSAPDDGNWFLVLGVNQID